MISCLGSVSITGVAEIAKCNLSVDDERTHTQVPVQSITYDCAHKVKIHSLEVLVPHDSMGSARSSSNNISWSDSSRTCTTWCLRLFA